MNNRSDSRFRYVAANGLLCSGSSRRSAQALRSARRATVLARCSSSRSAGPARQDERRQRRRVSLKVSQSASSRSMYSWVTRSGGYFGSGAIGVARSAPRSNSSFCIRPITAAISGAGAAQSHHQAERGVGFVAIGVGHQPGIGLVHPAEVGEPGGPVIAGTGVDAGQVDGHARHPTAPVAVRPAGSAVRFASPGLRTATPARDRADRGGDVRGVRAAGRGTLPGDRRRPPRWHGPGGRRQEQRAQADGRRVAGRGHHRHLQLPGDPGRPADGGCAARAGLHGAAGRRHRVHHHTGRTVLPRRFPGGGPVARVGLCARAR